MFARIVGKVRSIPGVLGRATAQSYVPELDGLRCVAILFVLVWHSALRAGRYIDHLNAAGDHVPSYYSAFPHGEIGVILFFFISGFVVSQPFVARPIASWKIGNFYRRRCMRIYPPYLIAMTTCFIVLGIVGHVPSDANAFREHAAIPLNQSFLASLFYLHSIVFDAPPRLNPPMWSLEIEVSFYAVLPALMLAYCRIASRAARIALMSAIIGLAVVASSLLVATVDTDLRLRWGLFHHAYLFLMGIVVADLCGDVSQRTTRKSLGYDLLFGCGIALLMAIGWMMTKNDARMVGSAYAFAIQALTILSLICMFFGGLNGRLSSAVLSLPWIRLVGTMCYSLYLIHIVVMTGVGEILARGFHAHSAPLIYLVYVAVMVSASLIAGFVFYLGVERPFAQQLMRAKPRPRALPDGRLQSTG